MRKLIPLLRTTLQVGRENWRLYRWRIYKSECPGCGGGQFLSLQQNDLMTRCMSCWATAMNLSLIPVVQGHSKKQKIDTAWEMSTYGATLTYLKKEIPVVHQSEYFIGVPSGQLVNGVMCQDVQQLSFADESIDVITSNQVFEHVADDIQGFAECYRVLRHGGALVLGIPLHDIPVSRQLAELRDGKMVFFGTPEYHGSRTTGPNSVPTFWHHSIHDICDRISKVGFTVEMREICLGGSQAIPSKVVYALKR